MIRKFSTAVTSIQYNDEDLTRVYIELYDRAFTLEGPNAVVLLKECFVAVNMFAHGGNEEFEFEHDNFHNWLDDTISALVDMPAIVMH
jgi:hypothetical protein